MVQDVLIEFEPIPGQKRKIKTYNDKMILAENSIKKGIELKIHSHPSSQVLTYVVEGRLLINVNGKEAIFAKGDSIIISEGIPHSAIVLDYYVPPPLELLNLIETYQKERSNQ
jgi:mannose-6-phosphate isomerase-like protein (cupin superfamily)